MTKLKTKPTSADFWPEKITRSGWSIDAKDMAQAWRAWRSMPQKEGYGSAAMASGLMESLKQGGGAYQASFRDEWTWRNHHYPCMRFADAMLQRARKAGAMRYENGGWVEADQ